MGGLGFSAIRSTDMSLARSDAISTADPDGSSAGIEHRGAATAHVFLDLKNVEKQYSLGLTGNARVGHHVSCLSAFHHGHRLSNCGQWCHFTEHRRMYVCQPGQIGTRVRRDECRRLTILSPAGASRAIAACRRGDNDVVKSADSITSLLVLKVM